MADMTADQMRRLLDATDQKRKQKREVETAAREAAIARLDPEQKQVREIATATTMPLTSAPVAPPQRDPYAGIETNVMGVPKFTSEFAPEELGTFNIPFTDVKVSTGLQPRVDTKPLMTNEFRKYANVYIENVLDFSNPNVAKSFEDAAGVYNDDGQYMTLAGTTGLQAKLKKANDFGASRYVRKDNLEVDIPFENWIFEQELLPEKETTLMVGDNLSEDGDVQYRKVIFSQMSDEEIDQYTDERMMFSLNAMDPKVGRPLYARVLNKRLKRAGVMKSRTRAAIIQFHIGSEDMLDTYKAARAAAEANIRFPMSVVGAFAGEALDVADVVGRMGGLGKDDEKVGGIDIRSSINRQLLMDNLLVTPGMDLQARLASIGANVPLHVAEELMYTYTGLGPRLFKTAAEIIPVSRALLAREVLKSKNVSAEFKEFVNREITGKKGGLEKTGKELEEYIRKNVEQGNIRSPQAMLKAFIDEKVKPGGIFGSGPILKYRQSLVQRRISQNMEIENAKLPESLRPEVYKQQAFVDSLARRREAVADRIKKTGGGNVADYDKHKTLSNALDEATEELDKTRKRSYAPPFIRDAKRVDRYLVIGAGTIGHLFQQNDEQDPSALGSTPMGELLGIFAGIGMSVAFRDSSFNILKNPIGAAATQVNRLKLGFTGDTTKPLSGRVRNYLAQNIQNYSPEIQEQLMARGDMYVKLVDDLIEAGVPEEDLAFSFAQISGLVGIQALEDVTRLQISTGQMANGAEANDAIQALIGQKRQLIGELRERMYDLDTSDTTGAKETFYRFVNAAIQNTEKSIDELTSVKEAIAIDGVEHVLGKVLGNRTSIIGGKLNDIDTIPQSFEQAIAVAQKHKIQLDENLNLPDTEFAGVAKEIEEATAQAVSATAKRITSELSSVDAARLKVKDYTESQGAEKVIAQGAREPVALGSAATPGDLAAVLFEAVHGTQKAAIQKQFASLGTARQPATFYIPDNQGGFAQVGQGSAQASVTDVFQTLFSPKATPSGVVPLEALRKKGLAAGDKNLLKQTFEEFADQFFLLKKGEEETLDDAVNNLVEAISDQDPSFIVKKGESKKLRAMEWILSDAAKQDASLPDAFRLSGNQIIELEKSLRTVANTKRMVADVNTRNQLLGAVKMLQDHLSKMEFTDVSGRVLPNTQLHIRQVSQAGEESFVPVNQVLTDAKLNWGSLKSRWYDPQKGNPIPEWMAWGDRNVQEVTEGDILGVKLPVAPREWLNINQIQNKTPEELVTFAQGIAKAIGTRLPAYGTSAPRYVFMDGTPSTQAFTDILQAQLSSHLINKGEGLTLSEAMAKLRPLEDAFVITMDNGQTRPMFTVDKIFDDGAGTFGAKSIGKANYDAYMGKAEKTVQTAAREATKPVTKMIEDTKKLQSLLQQLEGRSTPMSQLGNRLVEMGPVELEKIRVGLKKAIGKDATDEQINEVFANVYLDYLSSTAFRDTGRQVVGMGRAVKGESILVQEFDVSHKAIRDAIGAGDEEKAAMIKSMIGEKRYRIWDSASRLLAELEGDSAARISINGIPKALSVESYASRLYAWQRGAVGLRWVGTEALIQTGRMKNFNMLRAAMLDPEFGNYFLEMIRTGKPFTPEREVGFRRALAATMGWQSNYLQATHGEKTFQDYYGREYTLNPSMDTLMRGDKPTSVVAGPTRAQEARLRKSRGMEPQPEKAPSGPYRQAGKTPYDFLKESVLKKIGDKTQ